MHTQLKYLINCFIEVTHRNGKKERIPVRGYRVILSELPDIEFFIYRKKGHPTWEIYDAKFGQFLCLGDVKEDRNAVIKIASKIIKQYGIKKFKRLYYKKLKR